MANAYYRWRLPMWLLCYLSAFVLVILAIAFPETYLAKRQHDLKQQSASRVAEQDIDAEPWISISSVLRRHLWCLLKIMVTEPAFAFANTYTCLIYGLYYTFFECVSKVHLET